MGNKQELKFKSAGVSKRSSHLSFRNYFERHVADYISLFTVILLSILGIFYFFRLWEIDLKIPLSYTGGDDIGPIVLAKLLSE